MKSKYTKDKLSKAQEIFIQELVKGTTQRKAYITAYPKRKNWKESSIDVEASKLFSNSKVKQRYDELLQQVREKETELTMWTREESIRTLREVIEVNKKDIKRINDAYEQELEMLQKTLLENPSKAPRLLKEIIKQNKTRRASQVNNKGITDAVAELNKMQGFNEENINLNGTVVFEGENELED